VPAALWEDALLNPVAEFLDRPSKQFRAYIVDIAAAGGTGPVSQDLKSSIELLHAGSLIVDDIEDSASTHRGRHALHLQIGTALAINAGNWLYFYASQGIINSHLSDKLKLTILSDLQKTMLECHYGQALDIKAITSLKTGALCGFAMRLGASAVTADQQMIQSLGAIGAKLGVYLQILDDYSSLMIEKRTHKAIEDLTNNRLTWPMAWLMTEVGDKDFVA
jgi:geranylgeranyl pyrophosphate synthase